MFALRDFAKPTTNTARSPRRKLPGIGILQTWWTEDFEVYAAYYDDAEKARLVG